MIFFFCFFCHHAMRLYFVLIVVSRNKGFKRIMKLYILCTACAYINVTEYNICRMYRGEDFAHEQFKTNGRTSVIY
jgi:hypothetical protein